MVKNIFIQDLQIYKKTHRAHEAIRPTKISDDKKDFEDEKMKSLYDLITKRTLESQMAPSIYIEKTIKVARNNDTDFLLVKLVH